MADLSVHPHAVRLCWSIFSGPDSRQLFWQKTSGSSQSAAAALLAHKFGEANILTSNKQQYSVWWDTASQGTKRLDMLEVRRAWSPCHPWLRLWAQVLGELSLLWIWIHFHELIKLWLHLPTWAHEVCLHKLAYCFFRKLKMLSHSWEKKNFEVSAFFLQKVQKINALCLLISHANG